MRGTAEERFWAKVQKTDGCWEWIGHARIYGTFWLRGRTVLPHRLSWELANGPIPDGLWVLHHCDNGHCVRPDHLFLGTPADNNADMMRKGRAPTGDRHYSHREPWRRVRGSRHGQSRFTPEQVLEVRRRLAAGTSGYRLAKEYGVSTTAIYFIRHGVHWKEVS